MPTVANIIRRRHSRKRRRLKESRRSAFWFALIVALPLALAATPLLAALALALWLYAAAASHMPTPQATVFFGLEARETQFYDASGQTLIHTVADPLGDARRWLPLDALPAHVVSAARMADAAGQTSADARFDPIHAILQVWRYIMGLPLSPEGGLGGKHARETLLPLARASGLDASLLEVALAAESRRLYAPPALLEWRLNSAYYGHDAFGIEAAAQVYLGKSAADLSLAEAALVAAIVAAPALNPIDEPVQARERGADLLFRLLDAGHIDQAQFDEASAKAVSARRGAGSEPATAPDFIAYARGQAEDILDRQGLDGARLLARGGLRITTSLDLTLQREAECVLRAYLQADEATAAPEKSDCAAAIERSLQADAGALALLEVDSGKLLSLVGDALDHDHQPAVALQPFVYLNAFLRREFTPASMVYDLPQTFPGRREELIYAPLNADGIFRGPLNLRDAMAAQLLPPAVQVASATGLEAAIGTAQALGFNSLDASRHDLDILERGGAVSVLDAAYAYSVLAGNGAMRGISVAPIGDGFRSRDPAAVLSIEDDLGRLLWSYDESAKASQSAIVEPSAAYLVNDALADADARAAMLGAQTRSPWIDRPAAVVNGKSADQRESWTLGYTPDLALAVHADYAEGAPGGSDKREGAATAPVWRSLMNFAHAHLRLPARDWAAPADIEEFLVCEISGLLPATTAHCPTRREMVPSGTRLQRDRFWQTVEINRENGQLASVHTPESLRESVAYFMPPDEILDWWRAEGKPMPPSSYSTESGAASANPIRLRSPADYAYAGATVDIAAVINRADAESWLLEYGADVNPDQWFKIGERGTLPESGELATTWETALFSGIYTLRLSVTFADGSIESDTRLLTFDNTPPSIKLRAGAGLSAFRFPSQRVVPLSAEVSDNLTIARVEFYRDGERLGEDRNWPYGYELALDGAGEFALEAHAYDQVGNRAVSRLKLSVAEG